MEVLAIPFSRVISIVIDVLLVAKYLKEKRSVQGLTLIKTNMDILAREGMVVLYEGDCQGCDFFAIHVANWEG